MTRGSTWHKWDFHLHTPYSILNNQFGDPENGATWDRYVQAIEEKATELGIAAIGVTDYFTIDGYDRLLAYQAEGRLANVVLLPNIEFRVDKIIYRDTDGGDPRRLNIHVLFDPSVDSTNIREHFLEDLTFIFQEDTFDTGTRHRLKRSNLEELGRQLSKQHEKFQDYGDDLYVGCLNAVVSVEAIKEQLENDPHRFRGRYLIVLAEENLSLMKWDSQESWGPQTTSAVVPCYLLLEQWNKEVLPRAIS